MFRRLKQKYFRRISSRSGRSIRLFPSVLDEDRTLGTQNKAADWGVYKDNMGKHTGWSLRFNRLQCTWHGDSIDYSLYNGLCRSVAITAPMRAGAEESARQICRVRKDGSQRAAHC